MTHNAGSTLLAVLFFALLVFTLSARPAHAYIDIGTAGFAIQLLLAGFFGSLLTLTIFWKRFTRSLARFASRLTGAKKESKDHSLTK